jgi:hypothetical protein
LKNAVWIFLAAAISLSLLACGTSGSDDAGVADSGNPDGGGGGGKDGGGGDGGNPIGPGDFAGTIKIDWTYNGVPFTVKMDDATLTVKDNGIDETNYTLAGTAVISPVSFSYSGSLYTLSDPASKSYSEKYGFKVLKTNPPTVRWSFMEDWTYASGGSPFMCMVNFNTRTGTACATLSDVPVQSLDNIDGQFTMDCMAPAYGGTAVWDFTKK